LAGLRAIPAARLAGAVEALHLPLVDGVVVPDEPGILFARGEQHDVPFMTGADSYDGAVMPWTGRSVQDFLESWGGQQREVRALYSDDFAVSDQLGASRLFGDKRYLIAARYLAKNMSNVSSAGYLYYFSFVPEALRSTVPGALHASENGPLFGRAADGESRRVGQTMRAYWISFARSGNPNGPGLPQWPAYEASSDRWLVIGEEPRVQAGVVKDRLDFLERRYLERVGGL
jgi:para-nitrobenzyl esterase